MRSRRDAVNAKLNEALGLLQGREGRLLMRQWSSSRSHPDDVEIPTRREASVRLHCESKTAAAKVSTDLTIVTRQADFEHTPS